ncbi:MAG: phosphotransferase [Pseudomonadota bacterium]
MSENKSEGQLSSPGSDDILDLAYQSLKHWGLSGSLSLIKERENSVYAFTGDGQRFALRVHRLGYHSDQALASEHLWVRELAKYGLRVPKAIPTLQGTDFAIVATDKVTDARQVDLMAWIVGEQIGSIESGIGAGDVGRIYQTMGQVAAQVHNQASAWNVPADFERHHWDVDGLLGEQPFWGRFWELAALTDAQRELIARARTRLQTELSDYGKTSGNYSMVHADFAPENFLIHDGDVRVIDFDDAGFGWHLFELATALYFIQRESYFAEAKAALIAGYREAREISDNDLAMLPAFLAARSLTYLGWVHDRPDSEPAKELTPILVDMCCETLNAYLSQTQ